MYIFKTVSNKARVFGLESHIPMVSKWTIPIVMLHHYINYLSFAVVGVKDSAS